MNKKNKSSWNVPITTINKYFFELLKVEYAFSLLTLRSCYFEMNLLFKGNCEQ